MQSCPSEGVLLGGRTILVADDARTNRLLVSRMLQRAGATVVAVEDGAEACEAVKQQSFDLVLMDMQMPVLSGLEAARRLKTEGFGGPIVALTAAEDTEQECRLAGCDQTLLKPVGERRLIATVLEALGMATETLTPPEVVWGRARQSESPLLSTLPDDPEFQLAVEEFVESLAQRCRELEECIAGRNVQRVAHWAHWLKGAGGMAGFSAFTEPARLLERHAREENWERAEASFSQIVALQSRVSAGSKDPAN